MNECNHCWHDTGNMLTSNPPQYQLICCHCGATENLRSLPPFERDNGEHGEFAKGLPMKGRVMTTEITDEQYEELKRSKEQAKQQAEQERLMDAANRIAKLAKELGVAIVGTAQLAEISPGVMGVVTSWGVQAIK